MSPAELMLDRRVEETICRTLRAHGIPPQDLEDGRQDVYVKLLVAFKRKVAPADLEEMTALCAKIAEEHAIDLRRRAETEARDLVAGCDPDELEPLGRRVVQRDPVDAGRQLEVLAQLFREGRMPPHGVDILEGVACKCRRSAIARDLKLRPDQVRERLRQMRETYRRRMEKLGLLSNVTSLHAVVMQPGAIATLRAVA